MKKFSIAVLSILALSNSAFAANQPQTGNTEVNSNTVSQSNALAGAVSNAKSSGGNSTLTSNDDNTVYVAPPPVQGATPAVATCDFGSSTNVAIFFNAFSFSVPKTLVGRFCSQLALERLAISRDEFEAAKKIRQAMYDEFSAPAP